MVQQLRFLGSPAYCVVKEPMPRRSRPRSGDELAVRSDAYMLELAAAPYQAHLAERRYEASDPENRLVTAELESRWNCPAGFPTKPLPRFSTACA
jgi:hypothetical protein